MSKQNEVIVRIIKPKEQPDLPERKAVAAANKGRKKNLFQIILSGILLFATVGLGIFIAINFFKIGVGLEDLLILLGLPLVVGAAAGYVIS